MGTWREMSGIVCDKRMPIVLIALSSRGLYNNNKTVIGPVLMGASETWALRKAEQDVPERRYGNVVMYDGNKENEKIRNIEIIARAGAANMREQLRQARLRCTPKYRKTETEVELCYKKLVMHSLAPRVGLNCQKWSQMVCVRTLLIRVRWAILH